MWDNWKIAINLFYIINIALVVVSFWSEFVWEFYVNPLFLLECFILLGLVTSDYLLPSLSIISTDVFNISSRISGITILSLGNSIPDITGTYQSMKKDATSLAIGELLGGLLFVLTVVIGLMALSRTIVLTDKDLELNDTSDISNHGISTKEKIGFHSKKYYIHDILIFTVLILIAFWILSDGTLAFWECLLMSLFYIVYVIYQINDYTESTHTPDSESLISQDRIAHPNNGIKQFFGFSNIHNNILLFNKGIQTRRDIISKRVRNHFKKNSHGWIRMTLKDLLDIWGNENEFNDEIFLETNISNNRLQSSLQPISSLQEQKRYSSIPPIVITDSNYDNTNRDIETTETDNLDSNTPNSRPQLNRPITQKSLSCNHLPHLLIPISPSHSPAVVCSPEPLVLETPTVDYLYHGYEVYNELINYPPKTVDHQFLTMLFTAPLSVLLNAYLPAINITHVNKKLSPVTSIKLVLSPIIISVLLYQCLTIWAIIMCIPIIILLTYWEKANIYRYNSNVVAIIEFIVSLCTISYSVKHVVRILTNWTERYNLTQEILGLTIFAWGNSVGDLISNVTFTQLGAIDIAISACFGGPLLCFLFGLGIDGLLILLNNYGQEDSSIWKTSLVFKTERHFYITTGGVISAIIVLTIGVPLNGWVIDKKISVILLSIYLLITALNVYIEACK
ncbi:hypothetical protein Kpol_1031p60 [Vanderwaltozyma polyspora DSM 70294]|uniref:Sodium/calcium exchanger membrane region domain-containing protein n=1 Tax=Vanderwaltozyma polyspora (strain ATCC 22028 / DSM 70294 / BCRC 21397 / CBS 2163 / NBRC 10782 / NRRL Y-8283 / UCD 57-17) TaxID=436907 RepID=A7THZ1_VANPO|nr:uncharacterized protein Kpol_1031p60 [Vanderwaltozyma polyspora DSM 70294]EDO18153.1 hypothetical protein Kpol_1031p60 [Vanderwaltozyma polyspora DSM 70294]